MLKLDFDRINKKITNFLLQESIMPYQIRIGNKGVNFKRECTEDCADAENCYETGCYILDDKNRLKINITQKYNNLPNNVLWDIKRGKPKLHDWVTINSTQEADKFLRYFTGFW